MAELKVSGYGVKLRHVLSIVEGTLVALAAGYLNA
jgi:hypothetical protein